MPEEWGCCIGSSGVLKSAGHRLLTIMPAPRKAAFFRNTNVHHNALPIRFTSMCSGTDNVFDAAVALLDAAAEHPERPAGYEPRRVEQPYAADNNAHMQTYTQMKSIRNRVPLLALFKDNRFH